jgi:type IV secretion system protein VirD4
LEETSLKEEISLLAQQIISTDKKELSGVLNTARKELNSFSSPVIQRYTEKTTINLENVFNNKADLFLVLPFDKLNSYHDKVLRLLLSAIFIRLINRASYQHLEKEILFLLDEMPQYGKIKKIEDCLLIGRAYGVRIMAISQTLEKLKSAYPASWETFLTSNLKVFFGINDVSTSEYVSKLFGMQTIETMSINRGENKGELNKSSSEGESESHTGRPLFTADEIRQFGPNIACAFLPGEKPLLIKKTKYYQQPHYKGRFDKNPLEG